MFEPNPVKRLTRMNNITRKFISLLKDSLSESYPEHKIITTHDEEIEQDNAKRAAKDDSRGRPDTRSKPDTKPAVISRSGGANITWNIEGADAILDCSKGSKDYVISVSIYQNEILEHVIIFNPLAEEYYAASKGRGASYNGNRRTRVNQAASITNTLCSTKIVGNNDDDVNKFLAINRLLLNNDATVRSDASTVLSMVKTAVGQYDAFLGVNLNPITYAAALFILKESGALISNFVGKSENINKFDEKGLPNVDILATNPTLHTKLLKELSSKKAIVE